MRHHCLLAQMQLHPPKAAQSFSWTPELAFFKWWDFVRLRGYCFLGDRSVHRVGTKQTLTIPWYIIWLMSKKLPQTFAKQQKGGMIHLLRQTASAKKYPIVHLCRSGSVSTTGTQEPRRGKEDVFEKQIAGRWHIITLQEASEYVDHDILTGRFSVTHYAGCAILFNKDTFYPNIDVKSIYLHFTRRRLAWSGHWRGTRMGYARCSFTVPHFVDHHSAARKPLHISDIYAKKERHRQEAHPHHPCYHDWSTDWHVVAGDFNCTAWRCSNRDNISSIANAARPCTTVGTPDQFQTTGQTSVDSLSHRVRIVIGECACMVHSPSHEEHSACDRLIKVAITRLGSTWISSTGATLVHTMMIMINEFSSKNVLCRTSAASRKGASAISWATIRSLHERATICTCTSPSTCFVHHHEVTWWA